MVGVCVVRFRRILLGNFQQTVIIDSSSQDDVATADPLPYLPSITTAWCFRFPVSRLSWLWRAVIATPLSRSNFPYGMLTSYITYPPLRRFKSNNLGSFMYNTYRFRVQKHGTNSFDILIVLNAVGNRILYFYAVCIPMQLNWMPHFGAAFLWIV